MVARVKAHSWRTANPRGLGAVCRGTAAIWRPRPRLSRADWCAQHLRFNKQTSAGDARFDLAEFPWARGILDAADDPAVSELVIEGGTQIGKTTILEAICLSQADIEPVPMMLAGPEKGIMRTLRERFYGDCEASPALRDRIPPPECRNNHWLHFGRCICYLGWSGNTQSLSGRPCRLVLCTEIDRWRNNPREGHTAEIIGERVKAFTRYLIVWEGTPTDLASQIDAAYQASDRRRYLVPCPHCGHFQELRFFVHKEGKYAGAGGIVGYGEDGDTPPLDEVRARAIYRCEQGCEFESHFKRWICPRGVWCPAGCEVTKRGALVGTPERSPTVAGFHISSLYSRLSWGQIAAKYVTLRNRGQLQRFHNDWLGRKYGQGAKVPAWQDLGKRIAGAHPRGKVPAQALFLTAGVDVQEAVLYWVVRAWGQGGVSWLVDFGRLYPELLGGEPILNSDLVQLGPRLLRPSFQLVSGNVLGQTELAVRFLGIDINYRTRQVHDWFRALAPEDKERVRCVAGVPSQTAIFEYALIERSARDGKPYPGGMARWGLNTDALKADIQARWSYRQDDPKYWWCFQKPLEVGEQYLRQIVNEVPRTELDKRLRKKRVWTIRDAGIGNHWWDCEVYAMAMAEMVVGGDWDRALELAIAALPAPAAIATPAVAAEDQARGRIRRPERFLGSRR